MINVKPPEDIELNKGGSCDLEKPRIAELTDEMENIMLTPTARYLKEISKTLKDILKEMRERKM